MLIYIHEISAVAISLLLTTLTILGLKKLRQKDLYNTLHNYRQWLERALVLFLTVFYLLASFKIIHAKDASLEAITHHFDATGLAVGLVGIVIGLITVYFVEKQNILKGEALEENDKRIQLALNALKSATKEVVENLTNLKELGQVREVFREITKLISFSNENSNELYVFTHLTDFGQFLIRNLEIITSESKHGRDNFKELTQFDFYDNYMEEFMGMKEKMNAELKRFAKNNKMKVAVLANERLAPHKIDRVQAFLNQRILKGKYCFVIDRNKGITINYDNYNNEDIYIHHSDERCPANFAAAEKLMVQEIIKKDTSLIDSLQALSEANNDSVKFETLDYIPFQFFISVPKDENSETGWSAIMVFSNYYNLGYQESIVSFKTANDRLCKALKKMWEKTIESQKKKEESINPVKRIFAECKEIKIVLKKVVINDKSIIDTIGFADVTPVPDIIGKDRLLSTLNEFDVKANADTWYLKKAKEDIETILGGKEKHTYFSLGLFHNPLTEDLSDQYPSINNPFYSLKKGTGKRDNVIRVSNGGKVTDPTYNDYKETHIKGDKTSFDYVILTKLRINDNWIFVAGGINYYGSKNINHCIKFGANQLPKEVVDKPFAAVYQIPNSGPSEIKLILLSYLAGEDIVNVDIG